jgi:hypothetical protein
MSQPRKQPASGGLGLFPLLLLLRALEDQQRPAKILLGCGQQLQLLALSVELYAQGVELCLRRGELGFCRGPALLLELERYSQLGYLEWISSRSSLYPTARLEAPRD